MKKKIFLVLTVFLSCAFAATAAVDAQISFEKTVPSYVGFRGKGQVSVSGERFKDGKESLKFSWLGQAELSFRNSADIQASMKVNDAGVMVWIYSAQETDAPLRFTFWDSSNKKICWFDFNLNYRGWRTAWIKYADMRAADGYYGDKKFKERNVDGVRMTISTPATCPSGTVYIDRLSFRKVKLHDQITPDQQIPGNNSHLKRGKLWHWCRTWEWSQYPEMEIPEISESQERMVELIERRLDGLAGTSTPDPDYTQRTLVPKVEKLMAKYGIRRLPDGTVIGQPLLSDDEYNNAKNEMKIRFIQDIVYWSALDYMYTGNVRSVETAMLAMDHAIEQGFAYGSGQGTNHHYGYQVRNLYKGVWILRKEFEKAGKLEEYARVLTYWSGLGEVRKPVEEDRDELLDSWHTLQMCKVISAMLQPDGKSRYAYMKALTAWTDATMTFSNGTLGGLKVDGTSFHHGGHYPAYSVGAFAELGNFCQLVRDTDLKLGEDSRKCFKKSLLALQNYCQVRDWGFGVCGRHPFNGKIPGPDVEAFAKLAVLGDLSGNGGEVDRELAGAYLALGGKDKQYLSQFRKLKIKEQSPADGFTVYNYGGFGIHRRDGWMLTLKGYNSDVWSSEIYTHDNRYGRYLSYGSAQLIEYGSAAESGYVQDGWDWNRIPGVTSVHLPFELLDSPNKGTLMERNDSRFPGVSSLEGMNGCLAFTYVEKDRKNFCAGATATKSVFCFDNRIVHIGTGISNDSMYPTETVLYQTALEQTDAEIDINQTYSDRFPYSYCHNEHGMVVMSDVKENYYIIRDGYGLNVEKQFQTSPYDTRKKIGRGNFATAYIAHGVSPKNASYEYMLLVKPSMKEVTKYSNRLPYEVLQADNSAHVVRDNVTGITAYISYKGCALDKTLVRGIGPETIVMERVDKDGTVIMSVCTPDLGITEKAYTTAQPSQVIVKSVELDGSYGLAVPNPAVEVLESDGKTVVKAACVHGQPVEFKLKTK